MLIVGIFLVLDGILSMLWLKSDKWNFWLKNWSKSLFWSIVRVGIKITWFFPEFGKIVPCAMASLLEVFEDEIYRYSFSFYSM